MVPSTMFDGFQDARDRHGRRRFAASTLTSLLVLAAAGAALVALADPRDEAPRRAPVEVVFRAPAPVAKAAPPPPPPAPPKPKPAPARNARAEAAVAAAASAPPVPTAIPAARLAEADPSLFRSLGSVADLGASPLHAGAGAGSLAAAPPPPPPPVTRRRAPRVHIEVEKLEPPRPRAANAAPSYPEAARRQRREGLVVLRLHIAADGSVTEVEVVSGEPPFVAAAVAAARSWSYEPARVDGVATATYRLVRVPFRLRG